MKIEYSKDADALYVNFREVYVSKSKEIDPTKETIRFNLSGTNIEVSNRF